MNYSYKKILYTLGIVTVTAGFFIHAYAGTLSCTITTQAACSTGTIVLRMSSSSNATSELPSGSNPSYSNNVVCCTGVTGLSNSCGVGTFATALKLSSTTNAHVEQSQLSNYTEEVCLSVITGSVSVAYQANNCTGYDTSLGSMSSSTNAHVGTSTSYTTKICATASDVVGPNQSISFSISTTTISFGFLDSLSSRYGTAGSAGSGTEVEAHTITASSTATNGYIITVQGGTLRSLQNQSNTITQIGGVNTSPSPGTEQFGIRFATTTGTGLVTSPYNGSGFAYSGSATTSSQVLSGQGDGVTTVYSARYLVNVNALTESGVYTSSLIYVATANF